MPALPGWDGTEGSHVRARSGARGPQYRLMPSKQVSNLGVLKPASLTFASTPYPLTSISHP
jgi:hypothetical protein